MRKQRQNNNLNGRARRKGTSFNSEGSCNSTDNKGKRCRDHTRCCNGETPLCELLTDAIYDIFPEIQDNEKSDRSNSSEQHSKVECGSTLGQMIRRRYLLSRKSARLSSNTIFVNDQLNDSFSFEHNKVTSDLHRIASSATNPPASTTASKKKRKRKKKKRQDSATPLPSTICSNDKTSHSLDTYHSRNGNGSHLNDGKSMMSTTDHSLDAMDEAVKTETEKLIELEANHELPLLESLPSDDNFQAQESPSQFIDQIKPQAENIFSQLPDHTGQLPLTDATESVTIPAMLPEDGLLENKDSSEAKWKNPLQLDFLLNFESEENQFRHDVRDGGVIERTTNTTTLYSDRERGRILLHEWIDQFFFMNDESECIETCVSNNTHQDPSDDQKDEWDSFIKFCNERAAGREKALGIPIGDLLDIGSSIECRFCRDETVKEINSISGKETSTASASMPMKLPQVVMNPSFLEKPPSQIDNEISFESAFDYVALEEADDTPNSKNKDDNGYGPITEGKSDSNLSFLIVDVPIEPKQKKSGNRSNSSKKGPTKNNTINSTATQRQLYVETFTSKQLEEFFREWLIAGVDEENIVQASIRKEIGLCESENETDKTSFPIVTSESRVRMIKNRVIETTQWFTESLEKMNNGLEELRSKFGDTKLEENIHFNGMVDMHHCEDTCNGYLTDDILPVLAGEFSLPSHACADLQIQVWTLYLDSLGKMLTACDVYYKKVEEDLADQNGKLPLYFVSSPLRELYRKFAIEKIEHLSKMRKSFFVVSESSSMKELHTRYFWLESQPEDLNEVSRKLDGDCRKLIMALTEWTKVVNASRMSEINKERAKRLLSVFSMLRVVAESLGEEYKPVKRYFSQESNKYFEWLLSNIHYLHGVRNKMRLIEMDDVISLTTGVILLWRHVRIMQSRVTRMVSAETLPLSLHKWVLESSSVDSPVDERHQVNPYLTHSKCWPEFGGRRKAVGILAGLTYVWLRERCKEWKAEIASQELLNYFDEDLLFSAEQQVTNKAVGSTNKSGKKSKKKKKKKATSVSNGPTSNPVRNPVSTASVENEEAKSNDNVPLDSSDSVPGEILEAAENEDIALQKSLEETEQGSSDDTEIPIMEEASGKKEMSDNNVGSTNLGVEHGGNVLLNEENESQNGLISNESSKSVDGDSTEILRSETEIINHETFESHVAVKDERGCIVPAMEFLTDRLLDLLKQSENENIVIISD